MGEISECLQRLIQANKMLLSLYLLQMVVGRWLYEDNHDKLKYEMLMPMPDGSVETIHHLPVTAAEETLGAWSCPNGRAERALDAMKEKAQQWIDKSKRGI